jgi:hypothetical protein
VQVEKPKPAPVVAEVAEVKVEEKPKVAEISKPVKFEAKNYYDDDIDDLEDIPELLPSGESKPNVFVQD